MSSSALPEAESCIVCGLGNPGAKYEQTRHNAGFWVLEKLFEELGSVGWQEKAGASFARVEFDSRKLLLVKPETFMNRSGAPLRSLIRFFKEESAALIVVHDELDLEPGAVKAKLGGGAGGHNGVTDIIDCLGTKDFYRIRVGIGHPRNHVDEMRGFDVSSWVLAEPRPEEKELIDKAVLVARDTTKVLISKGLEEAKRFCGSNRFAKANID